MSIVATDRPDTRHKGEDFVESSLRTGHDPARPWVLPVPVSTAVYRQLSALAGESGLLPGEILSHVVHGEMGLTPPPADELRPAAAPQAVPQAAPLSVPLSVPAPDLRGRLIVLRQRLGLNQEQAAALCGYSRGMFSDLESGRRGGFSLRFCVERLTGQLAQQGAA